MSDKALDLLNEMLHFNPKRRITIEQCLRHEYFKELFKEEDITSCKKVDEWKMEPLPSSKEALQDILYVEARRW